VHVYKTRPFGRFARKEGIGDAALAAAAQEVANGQAHADLGGGVFKVRLPRAGGGKSGGFRVIVLSKRSDRYFVVAGFAKSAQSNIDDDELEAFRAAAKIYGAYSARELETLVERGVLIEVRREEGHVANEE
jgi:hypothetical protein